ncbi:MAG: hypothetical protein H7842_00480 [Gammaproteobacteria bacterium SHHR-1]|uniref:hypothetical protein n=1 Tax=Magnetovirga frankeli TaxID=947516 RepID=UPI00129355E8|nr:hypothetical protein D5125_16730 [gamma proteobacterium SS-5]
MNDEAELKLSQLYRQGAQEQPSAKLDGSILQLARSEIEGRAEGRARPRRRWPLRLPLSAAAGLLLAFGLVRLVMQEIPQERPLLDAAPAGPDLMAPIMRESVELPQNAAPAQPEERPLGQQPQQQKASRAMVRQRPAEQGQVPSAEADPPHSAQRLDFMASPPAPSKRHDDSLEAVPGDAQALLKRIEQLLQQGQREQARELLLELKKRHPQLPIPAGLEGR